jgi:hypothetical protein
MRLLALFLFVSCIQDRAFDDQLIDGIVGTVNVPGYGGLANVAVTLRNINTDLQRQTGSNNAGKYFFECTDDGVYELIYAAKGFLIQKKN